MTAYEATAWHDLFVATAGSSAALAGLVFVAVSINIDRILKLEGVPERALETVGLLVGALVVSVIGLIPGQSHQALGAELLAFSLLLCLFVARLPRIRPTGNEPRGGLIGRRVIRAAGTGLFAIGSVSLLACAGGGLYWIVAGILFATVGAVANAWVLLVEILR